MTRLWNHGRYAVMVPGGILNPGDSMDVDPKTASRLGSVHLKTIPLPDKPKAPRPETVTEPEASGTAEQPRRRTRKKSTTTEG